jgi:hypothetical protein
MLRTQVAIPQDHGSWVFIFSPLLVGVFAGGAFGTPTLVLIAGALAGFMLRQPVTMIVKVLSRRRPRSDLPAAVFWSIVYGLVGAAALAALIWLGSGYVSYLLVPGLPVLAWHLWLVSRRAERKQAVVELIATGVLALAAPGAYWVGIGHYDPFGWWLWFLVWLQSSASILYAYLRLEQRGLAQLPGRGERLSMAANALAFTTFNVVLTLALAIVGILPRLIFIPYAAQWLESLRGALHPAIKVKPVQIGVRQLIVSALWTVLFIIFWR